MKLFPTKRTLYSQEDIETIKILVEIFTKNLYETIRIETITSISREFIIYSWFNEEHFLDLLKQEGVNIDTNEDFIDMLPVGFHEIFILYCLHRNYGTSKESCRIIAKNLIFTGKGIILETLYKKNFFNINLEKKNKIIHSLVKKSEKGELPSCPFHYVDNRVKYKFFDTFNTF